MTARELFEELFKQYNARYWHSMEHKGCKFGKCETWISLSDKVEGYAELKNDLHFRTGNDNIVVKAGTTIRLTKASNMGDMCGTIDLHKEEGYDFRGIDPDGDDLINCRLAP